MKNLSNVRIVSYGPESVDVKVFVGDEQLHGIKRIEIAPIVPRGLIVAKIEVIVDQLEVVAERVEP